MKIKSLLPVLIPILFLTVLSCSLLDGNEVEPRIVLGEHIEGIRVGDENSTVVEKLGLPSHTLIPNTVQTDEISVYDEKTNYDRMLILVSAGHVSSVILMQPYRGTTKEGVRIGMSWEQAMKHLPSPDVNETRIDGTVSHYYYSEQIIFRLRHNSDGIIDLIEMTFNPIKLLERHNPL